MKRRWRRGKVDWLYEYVEGEKVVATIERFDPPNSAHFSIWSVVGVSGAQFPTKRDAQRWVEKQQDSTTATTTPEVKSDA